MAITAARAKASTGSTSSGPPCQGASAMPARGLSGNCRRMAIACVLLALTASARRAPTGAYILHRRSERENAAAQRSRRPRSPVYRGRNRTARPRRAARRAIRRVDSSARLGCNLRRAAVRVYPRRIPENHRGQQGRVGRGCAGHAPGDWKFRATADRLRCRIRCKRQGRRPDGQLGSPLRWGASELDFPKCGRYSARRHPRALLAAR